MSICIGSLTFDCGDPEKQAQFWAAALRLEIEHVGKHKAQISLGGDIVTATEEWSSIKTGIPGFPQLVFARVPEGKVVKNRVHLDTNAPSVEEMRAEVKRLVALGATVVQERSRSVPGRETKHSDVWSVMQDPEGNEFCVGVDPS